jgi:hypothetical protein
MAMREGQLGFTKNAKDQVLSQAESVIAGRTSGGGSPIADDVCDALRRQL